MKQVIVITALALVATTSSCGSIIGRVSVLRSTNPKPTPFIGVVYDVALVVDAFGHGEVPWWQRAAGVLDFPLSVCVDVVSLPIDLVWFLASCCGDAKDAPRSSVDGTRWDARESKARVPCGPT